MYQNSNVEGESIIDGGGTYGRRRLRRARTAGVLVALATVATIVMAVVVVFR